MCALSSFSELQNITRHRSKEEIKSLLKNHRIKQAQMSSKCPETTKRSRNMESGLLFLLPYLRQALTGAFLNPHLVALSYIKNVYLKVTNTYHQRYSTSFCPKSTMARFRRNLERHIRLPMRRHFYHFPNHCMQYPQLQNIPSLNFNSFQS